MAERRWYCRMRFNDFSGGMSHHNLFILMYPPGVSFVKVLVMVGRSPSSPLESISDGFFIIGAAFL